MKHGGHVGHSGKVGKGGKAGMVKTPTTMSAPSKIGHTKKG